MKFRLLTVFLLIASALCPVRAQINTDAVTEVGRNALYFEDYLLAIRYFNQVIEAKPYLATPYYLRAIAKYSLDDYAGAEADATRALDINPFLPDAWEVRGVARQCLGKNREAVADYDRALTLLPYNRQLLFSKALAEDDAGLQADSTYSTLIAEYPQFENGFVGRAQMLLHRGDTVAARADLEQALAINPNCVQALQMRAAVADTPEGALADMEQAVTVQPDRTYLRMSRAIARYNAGDLNGALADMDYVLAVEPLNYAALFNRAMLRTEMSDNDRALQDLNRLLQLKPGEPRVLFNRAVVLADKRQYDLALADADALVEAYPEMFAAYSLRGDIRRRAGLDRQADADFRRANALAHRPGREHEQVEEKQEEESLGSTANRFRALIALEEDREVEQTFNAAGLRGRVQDRNSAIEILPLYQLSYYHTDASSPAYVRQVAELNASHSLPMVVYVTYTVPTMSRQSDHDRHFASLAAMARQADHSAITHFASAMDYTALRNYPEAIAALDTVISLQPDFAPAYLQRASLRILDQQSHRGDLTVVTDAGQAQRLSAQATMILNAVLADLDRAIQLDPMMAIAHYNRGTLLLQMGAYADAIDSFSQALQIEPSLGPAYFNRGYARYSRGNRDGAESDLSRAGQLGVSQAYNLLKRMQQQ